ncbi:MAG TPA: hypothetical protein VE129_19280 [Thermoanaerobaculia bacterium]|nr:hypothetical protein [Thermoanaerobaculia bacterium]
MTPRAFRLTLATLAALAVPGTASAQSNGWGRVSLFIQGGQSRPDDGSASFSSNEAVATLTLRSAEAEKNGFEYGFDGRGSTYGAGGDDDRQNRFSLWDAWAGGRFADGRVGVRVGQQWITELGGLGSVGGALVEVRGRKGKGKRKLTPRFGVFGGLEPKGWEAGWVSGVKKGGVYAALDGEGGQRHVLGFVTIRNSGLTERSVITTTNFIPVGKKLFFYVAGEYDVAKPGGQADAGLSYAFVNARWTVSSRVELQGLYHRGHSYDARTLTQDQIDGRPVDPRLLAGFLYESAGGRLTVEVARGVRVFAGYASDRGSRDDGSTGRITAGVHAGNVLGSGIDVTISDNRIDRPGNAYDSWYASIGRSFGRKVYVSLDYATALSVLRFTSSDGIVVESRPQSNRFSLNGSVNLGRSLSLLFTAERSTDDTAKGLRGMGGLSVRF